MIGVTPHANRPDEPIQRVVEFLSDHRSYPEETQEVQRVETHISWVFLTDRYAYKLRKPVQFEFLNYSTAHRRLLNCFRELRLGRRLAPEVYLEIVPVTEGSDGTLSLRGSGSAIEYLVKMRRLPRAWMLDTLIRNGEVVPQRLKRFVQLLVDFYAKAASGPQFDRWAHPNVVCKNVAGNFAVLNKQSDWLDKAVLRKVHTAQLQLLELRAELFHQRIAGHHIREGHGDLRPEHVCLLPSPQVFDPVEFSKPLRAVDPIDELGFLAMECEFLGDFQTGSKLLSDYLIAAGDHAPVELIAFYKTYRACVRAKVEVLRGEQLHAAGQRAEPHTDDEAPQAPADPAADEMAMQCRERASRYLDLAADYVEMFYRPKLLITMGLMGTGKSTVATALAERLAMDLLQSDQVRQELAGRRDRTARYQRGIYAPEVTEQVYGELLSRAEHRLAQGISVLLDATFLRRAMRDEAREVACRCGADPLWIECDLPPEQVLRRLSLRSAERTSISDGRPSLFHRQRSDYEPPAADEPAVRLSTAGAPGEVQRRAVRLLRAWAADLHMTQSR